MLTAVVKNPDNFRNLKIGSHVEMRACRRCPSAGFVSGVASDTKL